VKAIGSFVVVLMLAAGAAGLAYARWTRAVANADAALAEGQLDRARAGYAAAAGHFDRIPATRQLFASEYARVIGNELWILYRLERFDDTIDLAEHSPDAASPHFWSGCAFFEKARTEDNPEQRLGWFTRAEEEFHRAAEAAPDDWDTKFDFELTTRLASELRKQPKTAPKQLMQLLRPPPAGAKSPRRVG
jgi:tetratricopeptide (TPR) repeat protein